MQPSTALGMNVGIAPTLQMQTAKPHWPRPEPHHDRLERFPVVRDLFFYARPNGLLSTPYGPQQLCQRLGKVCPGIGIGAHCFTLRGHRRCNRSPMGEINQNTKP
jgi:hypothetical protein